jgi:hypothetical protein
MAVNSKSLENLKKGKKFSSTNPPKNPGRHPNVYEKYVKEERVSLDDQRAIFSSILAYDADEIDAILKSKNKPPVGMVLLLKAIATDLKKGELINYEKLMDRTHGKSTQPVDIPPDMINRISMSPEERQKRIEELLKKSESKTKTEAKHKTTGRKRTRGAS